MRTPFVVAALCGVFPFAAGLAAQSPVQDVGLTFTPSAMLPAFAGHDCGPFSCTPVQSFNVGPNSGSRADVFGAAGTPFVLGISLATAPVCLPIAGLGNSLLLDPATVSAYAIGVTPPPGPVSLPCQVTRANVLFPVPVGAPSGLPFRLQGIAVGGSSGVLAFTIAIDAAIV